MTVRTIKRAYWRARSQMRFLIFGAPPWPWPRWDVHSPQIDEHEAAWWREFAAVIDEVAWVHTPEIRRVLRGPYLREVIARVPRGGTIVDFGCGAGWLSVLLAELGAKRVVGVDQSPAQIQLAQRSAKERGLTDVVQFTSSITDEFLRSVDTVILHAVLHHMTCSEIDALFERLQATLKPGATISIFEPITGRWSHLPWSLPVAALRLSARLRTQSSEEQRARREIARFEEGPRYPGHGPSPKEMPFSVGELEQRLSRYFEMSAGKPALFMSIIFVMELILLQKTYPTLGSLCLRYLLPAYVRWERLSLRFAPKQLWQGWTFCLFTARQNRIAANGAH